MSYNPNSTSSALTLSGTTSGSITQNASAVTSTYSVIWPAAQAASSGLVLTNDGAGNLSWASAGTSGANTTLSNLISPIAINQTLLPATNATFNLGSAPSSWLNAFFAGTVQTGSLTVNFGSILDGGLITTNGSGKITVAAFRLTTAPTSGFVLTSDSTGNGTWQASSGGTPYTVDTFTLSPTDITNQFVTLTSAPDVPADTILTVIGGPMQAYTSDYTVSGSQLNFAGDLATGGNAALISGDKLVVQFN